MHALGRSFSETAGIEGQSITELEKTFITKKRNTIYIALEDINFDWRDKEVQKVRMMWESDYPIKDIAKKLRRPIDDVAMLIYDQALKRKIKPREGGLMGEEN